MLTLTEALKIWGDMQTTVDRHVIRVRDFTSYGDAQGIIVTIDGDEPTGIRNAYISADEIEHDLLYVVPAYVKDGQIWEERKEQNDDE